jgi:hypothetical protein
LASALLNTWNRQSTQDENNYNYYTWIYNSLTNAEYQLPIDDIATMANQCPSTNGRIVYAARNLYNSLMEENFSFDNACDDINYANRKAHTTKTNNTKQETKEIAVYPNPTKGYVYITLPTAEKACWQITVTNLYGKKITEKSVRSNASKTFINIQGATGIYFINILNCTTGKLEVKKVILE